MLNDPSDKSKGVFKEYNYNSFWLVGKLERQITHDDDCANCDLDYWPKQFMTKTKRPLPKSIIVWDYKIIE